MRVRALQAEEPDFEPQAKQATWRVEVVVGRGRKQMHVGRVAAHDQHHLAIKAVGVSAVADLQARNEVAVLPEQLAHGQRCESGVRCGVSGVGR